MSKRRLMGFGILFICSFVFLQATISYGDNVLIYQQSGGQISFLYSKCQKSDKSEVEKDRHINRGFGNWWRLVNPDKSTDKRKIKYGDEISLVLVTSKQEKYYLYAIKEDYAAAKKDNPKNYYNVYTVLKKRFSAEEKLAKWGRFKIIDPLYFESSSLVNNSRPIILEYLESGVDSRKYLNSTTILDESLDVWYVTTTAEISYPLSLVSGDTFIRALEDSIENVLDDSNTDNKDDVIDKTQN